MKKGKEILLGNQGGFTLIEIIAVLVILGILAAVAVPKYMDLQNQARLKAAEAAMGETKARLSNGYGQYLLANNGSEPADIAAICTQVNDADILPVSGAGNVDVGVDYVTTLAADGLITVTHVQGELLSPAQTSRWVMP